MKMYIEMLIDGKSFNGVGVCHRQHIKKLLRADFEIKDIPRSLFKKQKEFYWAVRLNGARVDANDYTGGSKAELIIGKRHAGTENTPSTVEVTAYQDSSCKKTIANKTILVSTNPKITSTQWAGNQCDNLCKIAIWIEQEGLYEQAVTVCIFNEKDAKQVLDTITCMLHDGTAEAHWQAKNNTNEPQSFYYTISYKNLEGEEQILFDGKKEAELLTVAAVNERDFPHVSTHLTPVTIYNEEFFTQKYEPCKFTAIKVSCKGGDPVTLFDETKPAKSMTGSTNTFNVIAGDNRNTPSVEISLSNLDRKECRNKNSHTNAKLIIINNKRTVEKPIPDGAEAKVSFKVKSNLSAFNIAPLQYIWPSATTPNIYSTKIASCRYTRSLLVNVYPDIKWELLFDLRLDSPLAYKHANMPSGDIYKRHQELARKSGYDRAYSATYGKTRATVGIGLLATWDKHQEFKLGLEFNKKIKPFTQTILKAKDLADKAVSYVSDASKRTGGALAFEVMSPALEAKISWCLEPGKGNQANKIAVVGELDFKASPLVGAKLIVDMITMGSNLHPALKVIKKTLDFAVGGDLGKYVTFQLEFYGQIDIEFKALKFNSLTGFEVRDKMQYIIKGEMGVKGIFKVLVDGQIHSFGFDIKIGFSASAELHSYFGGEFTLGVDDKGIYAQPILKFSGLTLSVEVKGYFGKWERTLKIDDGNGNPMTIIDSNSLLLGKKYLN